MFDGVDADLVAGYSGLGERLWAVKAMIGLMGGQVVPDGVHTDSNGNLCKSTYTYITSQSLTIHALLDRRR